MDSQYNISNDMEPLHSTQASIHPFGADESHKIHLVELFAGAAGLAQGFENSGVYETAALYDISKPAKDSYLVHKPNATYCLSDVSTLDTQSVLNDLGGRRLHGVLGGPPCQGFSLAGKRQSEAETNKLVEAYGKQIEQLKPSFLVMENVPQLLFHKLFEPLLGSLEKSYNVTYGLLNAARYGVPQTRHRLFVVAYDKKFGVFPTLPNPTHGQSKQLLYAYHLASSDARIELNDESAEMILGADPVVKKVIREQRAKIDVSIGDALKPLVTVEKAISDLKSTFDEGKLIEYERDPISLYQEGLRKGQKLVANCVARRHAGEPLNIVKKLREGGTPSVELGEISKKYYSQAYSRLHRAGLARTLTTYFQNAGSGRFFHYEKPRTLTIREAARLQGFPDEFVFLGSLAEQMQLVGNAVPLPLAQALGEHVLSELGPHLET